MTDVTESWFWEGNVVETIVRRLEQDGWSIVSKADTRSKEQGIDIHAAKNGKALLIEAKGYPSTTYRDPRRAGQIKPTNPTLQAKHWYSHALLKAVQLQTEYPDAIIALGFPNFPRYRNLFEETKIGLQKLGVAVLAVSEDGKVVEWKYPQTGTVVFA